ncbi:DivIVA domain-containing protein [Vagococcus coleopterorum]|uniref:DivIVA domain-containing protein n=1 Tax=Vagococcus coleopterorum TaxID=2714946 RepID=A0A6G8APN3_9ENTE|nr:DivIVA domain-containing protein [Vagococcus coleopterorum]QIL46947.1 DivIVA domain-containing protein [Vagococcus coleopterorum]
MGLSPLDIKNKSFSNKMRGYNSDEVDDFLDQVIADFEGTLREHKEMEKALKHANEKLTYFNELKDALNQSIVVAQDTADKLKESAEKESEVALTTANAEAEKIIREAKEQADTMVSDATRHATEIIDAATQRTNTLATETDDLKSKTKEFHRNISLILESQLEVVKSKDWDNLLAPFSTFIDDKHQNVKDILNQNPKKVEVEEPAVEEMTTEVIEPSAEIIETPAKVEEVVETEKVEAPKSAKEEAVELSRSDRHK